MNFSFVCEVSFPMKRHFSVGLQLRQEFNCRRVGSCFSSKIVLQRSTLMSMAVPHGM